MVLNHFNYIWMIQGVSVMNQIKRRDVRERSRNGSNSIKKVDQCSEIVETLGKDGEIT